MFLIPFFSKGKTKTHNHRAGFSAIEMLVVTGIIVIVSSVVLANVSGFRNKTTLDLIAQEIAISIREAQVFGIATRAVGEGEFPAYGVYFSLLDSVGGQSGASKKFVLFADLAGLASQPGNRVYDASNCGNDQGECVEELSLSGPFAVVDLCVDDYCDLDELSISFKRPFPDALICPDNAPDLCEGQKATIVVASETGDQKEIVVWNNGQIAVQNPE